MARKKLIHVHSNVYSSGAPKAPTAANLEKGEIAINYNDTEPAMFIKNESGNIIKFNAVQRSEITGLSNRIDGITGDVATLKSEKVNLNGTDIALTGSTPTFYAPTASGTTNNVLVSDGANKSPKWVAQSSLSVGTASTASKTTGKLTLMQSDGTTKIADFDGSASSSVTLTAAMVGAAAASHSHVASDLPTASTTDFGIVKIGTSAGTVAAGNHTHSEYVNPTVTNKGATWAWNSTVTAATIGSTSITIAAPAKPTPSDIGAAESSHTHTGADINNATTGATGVVKVGSFLNISGTDGTLSVATGNSNTTVAVGNHTHNYAGSSSAGGAANSTKGTLTLKNSAGSTVASFNGSESTAVTLNASMVGAAESSHTHSAADITSTASTSAYGVTILGTAAGTAAEGNHTHAAYVNPTVTDKEATWAWGTKVTAATIGNTAITITSPSKPTPSDIGAAASTHSHTASDLPTASTSAYGITKLGTAAGTAAEGNHTHSAYVNPTVTNNAPTLAWGTTSTAATIGQTAITVTAMAKPTPSDIGAAESSHTHTGSQIDKATTGATGVVKVGSFLNINATDGTLSVATGNSSTTVAVGNHTHNYAGSSSAGGAANSTKGTLTVNGTAFNGSADTTVSITVSSIGAASSSHTHTISALPYETTLTNDSTKVPASSAVKAYVDGLVASPVNYKGAITNGTLPSSPKVGDLYIVQTTAINLTSAQSATGVAQKAEVGDYIIARTTSTWDVIQKNITGAVTSSEALTDGNFVLGAGNQTIKNSTYGPSSFAAASHSHGASDLPTASTTAYGVTKLGTGASEAAQGNHTHSAYVNPTVTNNNPTLAWGTKTTAATIGETAITFTPMSLPSPSDIGAAASTHSHTGSDISKATTGATGVVKVGSFLNINATDGTLSVATGNSSTTVAVGNHTHNYAGSSSAGGAANSTKGTLTVNGTAFNGSADTTVSITVSSIGAAASTHSHGAADLPTASTTAFGIMKVGSFLGVSGGVVSAATGNTSSTLARGDHSHNYAGSSSAGGAADSTKGTLTIKNNAGTAIATFNGSASTSVTLTYETVGAAAASHTHNYAGSSSAGGDATNADKVDGYHVSVVTSMPASPAADTIYILK